MVSEAESIQGVEGRVSTVLDTIQMWTRSRLRWENETWKKKREQEEEDNGIFCQSSRVFSHFLSSWKGQLLNKESVIRWNHCNLGRAEKIEGDIFIRDVMWKRETSCWHDQCQSSC
jgi:hypothetical protein